MPSPSSTSFRGAVTPTGIGFEDTISAVARKFSISRSDWKGSGSPSTSRKRYPP
jgi:hypothetical protein